MGSKAPAEVETVAVAEAAAVEAEPAIIAEIPAGSKSALVTEWKVADVLVWLKENELEMHAEAFKAHSINGKMLLTLEEQDMYKVLNIVSPLHRKKLMMSINELRSSYLNP